MNCNLAEEHGEVKQDIGPVAVGHCCQFLFCVMLGSASEIWCKGSDVCSLSSELVDEEGSGSVIGVGKDIWP